MKKMILPIYFFLFFCQLNAQLDNRPVNISGCGLSYVHKSIKVSTRTEEDLKLPGNKMPVTFLVEELPQSCYTIVAAYVWWTVSFREDTPMQTEVTITSDFDQTSKYKAIKTGDQGVKCWEEDGTRGFRADVTPAIEGNGYYNISVNTGDWETDGITLVIIYRDLSADWEGHILINDGLITKVKEDAYYTLTDIKPCGTADFLQAFMIASDIQKNVGTNVVFTAMGKSFSRSRDFWNSEILTLPGHLLADTAQFSITNIEYDCFSWLLAGIYYRTTSCGIARADSILVRSHCYLY
jgi:hypothetical protein